LEILRVDVDDEAWGRFVASCPDANVFHHPSWTKLLMRTYRFGGFVLAAVDDAGGIRSGMPVVESRSPLGRRRWVSQPFTDHCPPLSSDTALTTRLIEDLHRRAEAEGVGNVEVRAAVAGEHAFARVAAVTHTLDLRPGSDLLFRGFRSANRRNIRHAEGSGLSVRRAESIDELTGAFYRLHLETRRRLGVPIQPLRFFRLLWEDIIAPGLGFVLLVHRDDMPLAGAVFLGWNRTLIYKYGASDPEHLALRPNNLLFWTAIQWACDNTYETLDFGRTDHGNEGLRRFKAAWGGQEEPLVYTTIGRPVGEGSGHAAERAMEAVVRRSPPWVCRLLGELLYKYAA
jgi:CelD/BcsL family acetyltransferase involved in cellulose biosynthesis